MWRWPTSSGPADAGPPRAGRYDRQTGPSGAAGARPPAPARRKERTIAHLSTGQFLAAYLVAALVGAAVFLHADRNGSRHPTAWAVSVFLFLGIALPVYVLHVVRSRRRRRL